MKTKTPQHTPLPWGHAGAQLIGNEAREMIGLLKNTDAGTDAQANAAYIVKCVNSHEDLLNAMDKVCKDLSSVSAWQSCDTGQTGAECKGLDCFMAEHRAVCILEQAIAKAEGQS